MTEHTVKSFGEQLEALSSLVAQMGGLAEAQFAAAIEAIARRDSVAANAPSAAMPALTKSAGNEARPKPLAAPAHGGGPA